MGNSVNKDIAGSQRFQLMYNLSFIDVEKQVHNGADVYKVYFSNEVPAITLLRDDAAGHRNWDTVPPGNTELAAALGALIEEYEQAVNQDKEKQE